MAAAPKLDRERLRALIVRAGDGLRGDWLLVGGAAAALWFSDARVTEDVDLIGLLGTAEERLRLMDLAVELGLPVEAVNSAADYFVRRVPGWRDQIVVLHRGASATIHRPTATLFLALKSARLTATDLDDCLALLAHCAAHGEPVDRAAVVAGLAALPDTDDDALRDRRRRLASALVE